MCLTDTVGPGAKAKDRLRLPLTLQRKGCVWSPALIIRPFGLPGICLLLKLPGQGNDLLLHQLASKTPSEMLKEFMFSPPVPWWSVSWLALQLARPHARAGVGVAAAPA